MYRIVYTLLILTCVSPLVAQEIPFSNVQRVPIAEGWASNSVNTVVFRKNALVTWQDTQFVSFYNPGQYLVIGKRKLGTQQWKLQQTPYKGNAADAHNDISMMVDGDGYLHLAWDHHNNALRYCKSVAPGSLLLTEKMAMTGVGEQQVTYPEFYKLSNGNLLFFYRDGRSGQGNFAINQYEVATQTWRQLHSNLIDGEGKRNAYWQACVDQKGTIHISWVWRESPDVASNHDLCYARSTDGGQTWEKSTGEKYRLPITAMSAEYACTIPQRSELINQTSMCADENGNPFIATYWRDAGTTIPQYHLVYLHNRRWEVRPLNFRKTAFSLSGMGTKKIPIARPQILVQGAGSKSVAWLVFRDAERNNKVSLVSISGKKKNKWHIVDLMDQNVGSWEPTYDTELWKEKGWLHLFVQKTEQADAEGKANIPPQLVEVLECNLLNIEH
jgi:hypothetical protein